jgi:hypothetical protein
MLDHDLKAIWRAHAAGEIDDAQAQAAAEAAYGRRARGQIDTRESRKPASGLRRAGKREKVFGHIGRPLDRNAKVRLMHRARCMVAATEPGKHYGQVTAKMLAIFRAVVGSYSRQVEWRRSWSGRARDSGEGLLGGVLSGRVGQA